MRYFLDRKGFLDEYFPRLKTAARLSLLLLILSSESAEIARAQEADSASTRGSSTEYIIAASILPAFTIGGALYQNYATFWKNSSRVPFHVVSEPAYSLQNDKFGHAYYSSLSSDVIRRSYELAGVSRKTAAWLGAGLSVATELLVEVEDGFHTGEDYYGFSIGDASADIIGASIPLLKQYYPMLKAIDYKASFWPSEALRQGAFSTIFDDDESHFYWLSYNVHSAADFWPSWLNLAMGYSVTDLNSTHYLPSRHGTSAHALLYIGPDINLRGLPIKGKAWEVISGILSNVRIPLPAIEISRGARVRVR